MRFLTLLLQWSVFLFTSPTALCFIMPTPTVVTSRSTPTKTLMGPESFSDLMATSVGSHLVLSDYPVSPEPIHKAFQIGTFFSQPFFLLMIFLPKSNITKKIMGGLEIPLLYALIHFFIVSASIAMQGSDTTAPLAEFNNVFDPAGDSQQAFMGMVTRYPDFVAEEWVHVLCWDLFVARYIWIDGLKRDIFTAPAVLFCNLIGPPGLLIHFFICLLSGKDIYDTGEKAELENL